MYLTVIILMTSLLLSVNAIATPAMAAEANQTSQMILRAGSQGSFKGA